MSKNTRLIFVYGLVALVLIGCQPIRPQFMPETTTEPSPTTTVSPAEEENPVSAPQLPITPDVAVAIADLAQRLAVEPDDIVVVRVEEVDWPDSGLGCPQPDMNYLQVLTNGVFIQLSVGDQFYNYHSGGGRPPFLCTSPNEWVPGE